MLSRRYHERASHIGHALARSSKHSTSSHSKLCRLQIPPESRVSALEGRPRPFRASLEAQAPQPTQGDYAHGVQASQKRGRQILPSRMDNDGLGGEWVSYVVASALIAGRLRTARGVADSDP